MSREMLSSGILAALIVAALAAQTSRVMTTRSATGETPFHSANDRSRWCSVAAIGGYGQFEIDPLINIRDPKTKRRTWYTIDLVRHRGRDGKQHYYSSKPPLLTVVHAGVYAAVRLVTGLSLTVQTFTAARVVLVLVNLLPLAAFWWLWGGYWQRRLSSPWALVVTMTFLLWGTFVSTFANTLNNHLPGALAAGLSLWAVLKIVEQDRRELRWFVLAGFSAAFCAACELPALSWVAAIGVLLVQVAPRRAALGLSLGVVPVAIAFAVVNVLAHGDLRPPYAHRAVGELVSSVPRAEDQPTGQASAEADTPSEAGASQDLSKSRETIIAQLRRHGYEVSSESVVRTTRTAGVQELWDERTQLRFALVAGPQQIQIHQWDDWYDYPNSYWYPDRKQGVDRGERNRWNYLFQTTLGHHGVFSLTPMWLLFPLGAWAIWRQSISPPWQRLFEFRVQLMLAIVATSLVCFAFYIARPLEDRNYGGVSSGFRWMFWFTPLWCWLVAEALERYGESRLVRRLVLVALGISVFSATFPWTNPWTTPWLAQVVESFGP